MVGVLGAVAVRRQAFRGFSAVVSGKGLRLCRAVFRLHIVESLNRKLLTAGPNQNILQDSLEPTSFPAHIGRGARVKGSRQGVYCA